MLMSSPPPPAKAATAERETITADICIIGAGPGGLALAVAAAALGQRIVLVEKHKMGGTSLNYGSIPLSALHASAGHAHAFRTASAFGIGAFEPAVDRSAVDAQVKDIITASTPNASVERLTGLGIRVFQAAARFLDPRTLAVGEHKVTARRFVIATGASPAIPPVPGLSGYPYLTTETIFAERSLFDHLVILGGGAAGVEFAQAYRRLGSRVTLIEQGALLSRLDPELSAVIKSRVLAEGTVILESTKPVMVQGEPGRVVVDVEGPTGRSRIEGSHLLVACGRRPAITDIGLDAAKVAVTADGVKVNRTLRTSNSRVYAIGDVIGLPHSAHRAEYHARLLIKTLLLRSPAAAEPHLVPASIHTDPEFATVGLSEAEARAKSSAIRVVRFPLRENARALANRVPAGHIKIITDRRGRILGAAIAGRAAGELIGVWSLAISKQLTLDDMNAWMAPYPALVDVGRQAASSAGAGLAAAVGRHWVKLLAKLG